MWESLSQAGNSCDYISEDIIKQGKKHNGVLEYGPMSFQAIILTGIRSLDPLTAQALLEFVRNGGKLVVTDSIPDRSLSLLEAGKNDSIVQHVFAELGQKYQDRFFKLNSPDSEKELLPWTMDMLKKIRIKNDVVIEKPNKNVFQIRKVYNNRDIWFFTNSNRVNTVVLKMLFPTGTKTPWIWNPEDGSRKVYPFNKNKNDLTIKLYPLQSILLIFEPDMVDGESFKTAELKQGSKVVSIDGPWQVKFEHLNGSSFECTFEKLHDFGTSTEERLRTFAGVVTYSTTFYSNGKGTRIELGNVNKGVTELYLNGKNVGVNWYGRASFPLKNVLINGENKLEIKCTTVLSNYASSLKNNPTCEKWTKGFINIPMGLEGSVEIFKESEK